VHINLSSNLSSCYQNALIAAKEVGGVYPVDSLNLSTGSGHLVIEAANMAKNAMTAEEIVEKLCKMREKLDVSFVLQTLDYLRKGGRCSALTALGANLLQLRPEIEVKDGKMGVGNKYRGKMDKSISDYVRGRLEGRTDLVLERIFVTHSGVPAEIVADVMAQVKQLQPFAEVIETRAGCTITSHCGPNCLGVLFFKK
jgi:DegV family protein with EDD domain